MNKQAYKDLGECQSMQTYMLTIPRKVHKRTLKIMLEQNDVKKYIIAKERGFGGYEHWQIRLKTSNKNFFIWCKINIPEAHVEEAMDTWDYERKEGVYWTSDDTNEIRALRFGKPNLKQKRVLKLLKYQGDRNILVWYDPVGKAGKSWIVGHLWEQGKACYVPPTLGTPKEIIQWVHSAYDNEGLIIIDIPRSWKWNEALYTAIETIKDGLVYDPRYSARMKNIRGVKVLVMTNTYPRVSALSEDRWDIINEGGEAPLS
ncbi:replication associated protein [Chicken associated smacovirus]|uniref:Replication associated protein n=1 Tax=Chicken associated smacovirus TaxID=1932006 RepID=A0A1L6KWB4_9VIRU|nr:replication associated protein [Chicken associated smacovirus]APR73541.1 replication associated protein [Chicken associated smacovirus]AXL64544.1 replication associated protein [Chicken associated smacovirus]